MFGVHNSNAKIVMIKVSPGKENIIFRNEILLKQSGLALNFEATRNEKILI